MKEATVEALVTIFMLVLSGTSIADDKWTAEYFDFAFERTDSGYEIFPFPNPGDPFSQAGGCIDGKFRFIVGEEGMDGHRETQFYFDLRRHEDYIAVHKAREARGFKVRYRFDPNQAKDLCEIMDWEINPFAYDTAR